MKNKFLLNIIFILLLFCIIWGLVSNIRAGIVDETTPPETETIVPNNPTPVGENATITITDSEGNIFDFSSDNFIVGKSYIISATANEGYNNPTIEVNGVEQSIPYTFTVADTTPIVITANSTANTYTLTKISENATITITNSVGEEVDLLTHGETYTVSVVANAGCNVDLITLNGFPFVNGTAFTGGETIFGNDVEIIAIATIQTFDLTMNKTNASIAVNDNGMYYYFTTADCLTYGHSITIASEGNTGYTLNTFTVTMGGVSQTTSITNGLGTCTISLVTGDIEIFAESVEQQPSEPETNFVNFTFDIPWDCVGRIFNSDFTTEIFNSMFDGVLYGTIDIGSSIIVIIEADGSSCVTYCVVTMNSVSLQLEDYANGYKCVISNVTGDIYITATSPEPEDDMPEEP